MVNGNHFQFDRKSFFNGIRLPESGKCHWIPAIMLAAGIWQRSAAVARFRPKLAGFRSFGQNPATFAGFRFLLLVICSYELNAGKYFRENHFF
jgi:hypothetical protein